MSFMKPFFAAAAVASVALITAPAASADEFVTIGTGGVTGVYYPTGGAICRLVNKERKEHGIRCSVESTGGSVYNTRTIRAGELNFGVVQSDVQAAAVAGTGKFADEGAFGGLRAVFSVHPEPVQVMVRGNAGISSISDMAGKRVNIGNPGSGTRVLAEVQMAAAGISAADLGLAAELKSSEQAAALCDGKIDGAFWAAGLPNGAAMEATSTCDIKILDLASSGLADILASNSAYASATVPGGMYPGNPDDLASWGPKATFVTSTDTSEDVVYVVVKAVFENFDNFRKLHPAFARLNEEEMIADGLTAELHAGAVKYYKERGWM